MCHPSIGTSPNFGSYHPLLHVSRYLKTSIFTHSKLANSYRYCSVHEYQLSAIPDSVYTMYIPPSGVTGHQPSRTSS